MTYKKEIGFSNIRIPNEDAEILYTYTSFNTFPEEVFIHEFLHNLERIENEYNHEIPELHSYEKYNYDKSDTEGLKKWYTDYMIRNINNKKIGLSPEVYRIKPVHDSCFKQSKDLTKERFYEPENFIEEINLLIERLKKYFIEENATL